MIKVLLKLDTSFCKLMVEVIFLPCLLLFIGLSATFGVVCYFFEKIIGNSDEKLHANPANKVREKSTSDQKELSAPKQQSTKNTCHKTAELENHDSESHEYEIEPKEDISKSPATNRIIKSDKNFNHDCAQNKFTCNEVDVCVKTNDEMAQKEVENNKNFVEKVDCSHERSPDKTVFQVPSSKDDLQQTDGEKKTI